MRLKKRITLCLVSCFILTMLIACGDKKNNDTSDRTTKEYSASTDEKAEEKNNNNTDKDSDKASDKETDKGTDKKTDKETNKESDSTDTKNSSSSGSDSTQTAKTNAGNSGSSSDGSSSSSNSSSSSGNNSSSGDGSGGSSSSGGSSPGNSGSSGSDNSGGGSSYTPAETAPAPHEHSYSGSVTQHPTCTANGVKTYTCSCGDSYTESIPAIAHNWEAQYEDLYHEAVTREQTKYEYGHVVCKGCNTDFGIGGSDACAIHIVTTDCPGPYHVTSVAVGTETVVIEEAYTSHDYIGDKCSVCGQWQ